MKTPMVSSATSFQRPQTSLQSPMPRLPRSNVYSTRDPANPSASVHRKRFFTPSLTPKFLCAGYLNPGGEKNGLRKQNRRNPFKPPGTAESWDRSTRGKVAWLGDFRLSLYISPLMRPPYSEEIEPLVARRTHQKRRCPLWAQSRTVEEP